MTDSATASPYSAPQRARLPQPCKAAEAGTWAEDMLYRLLCILYAKGILSAARFRRVMPLRMRRAAYFYPDFQVQGCAHLRAAVQKQNGCILGDFELYDFCQGAAFYSPASYGPAPSGSSFAGSNTIELMGYGYCRAILCLAAQQVLIKLSMASVSIRGSP